MARQPMVTRTIVSTKVKALCMDLINRQPIEKVFVLARTYKDDNAVMKMLCKEYDSEELKVTAILEKVETKAQKKVFYIKEIQAEIELLADAETNAETKAALIRLAEKVRFSDPMSSEQLTDLENAISEKVALLKTLSDKNGIIGEIDLLLSKRNKMCKTLK